MRPRRYSWALAIGYVGTPPPKPPLHLEHVKIVELWTYFCGNNQILHRIKRWAWLPCSNKVTIIRDLCPTVKYRIYRHLMACLRYVHCKKLISHPAQRIYFVFWYFFSTVYDYWLRPDHCTESCELPGIPEWFSWNILITSQQPRAEWAEQSPDHCCRLQIAACHEMMRPCE